MYASMRHYRLICSIIKEMQDTKKKKRLILKIIGIIVACILIGIVGVSLYGKYQMSKIPDLSFEEALQYTTQDNENAIITVGIIKDGEASFTVYGNNGKELPQELHTYEIGSITKTFTASLICKAIEEDKINIDDTIDCYLDLPDGKKYPTIKQLITHTSGYEGYYFETPMISSFFAGRNSFYGITDEMVLNRVASTDLEDKEYSFNYSNFGFAVLGLVLEKVYQEDYTELMNTYLQDELHLHNTKISDRNGDLENYWEWQNGDAYISVGAITSDITDMLAYAQMQLDEDTIFEQCHESLTEINASTSAYEAMGIYMDAIGMSWIIDKENNFIWHNGGTGNYNSYIAFCPETQTAVVVLSNLPPDYKIQATVLGAKLMQSLQIDQ